MAVIPEFAKGAEQTTEEDIVSGDGEEDVVPPRPLYEMQSAPPKSWYLVRLVQTPNTANKTKNINFTSQK